MKKVLCSFVLLITGFVMLTAAGTQETTDTMDEVTLTYFTMEHPNYPLKADAPTMQVIAEKTGVTIEYQAFPSGSAYNEKLNVTMASGSLPDMMNVSSGFANQYGGKAFTQLDSYLESSATNLKKLITPEIRTLCADADGNLYVIPRMNQPMARLGWSIRGDWLETLGLEAPETIDEWLTVLTAFRDNDPDGNGVDDTVPMTGRGWPVFANMAPLFGMHPLAYGTFWQVEDGRINMTVDTPAFKEMVATMRYMVAENLLDKEFTLLKTAQWEERILTGKSGASPDYMNRADNFNNKAAGINADFQMVTTMPPKGPNGDCGVLCNSPTLNSYCVAVTKTGKNQDAAVRWIDYVFSDEGTELLNWGIEGETFEVVDGKKTYIGEFSDLMSSPPYSDYHLRASLFPFRFDPVSDNLIADVTSPQKARGLEMAGDNLFFPQPALVFTAEEQEELTAVSGAITPLASEYRDAVVIGSRDLSEWDDMIAQIKEMGLDRWEAILNAAYARYIAK